MANGKMIYQREIAGLRSVVGYDGCILLENFNSEYNTGSSLIRFSEIAADVEITIETYIPYLHDFTVNKAIFYISPALSVYTVADKLKNQFGSKASVDIKYRNGSEVVTLQYDNDKMYIEDLENAIRELRAYLRKAF